MFEGITNNPYLGSCIDPNFWFTNFMPVRQEKEFEPIDRSWQCYSSDDKREEENDRQSCRDVDHFAGSCHTLPQTEVDYHPGESQEAKQLQSHFSHVVDPIGHLQNSVTMRMKMLSKLINQINYFHKINTNVDSLKKFLSS